jgi:hypothetical protein
MLASACTADSGNPLQPPASTGTGSGLKVGAPIKLSPVGGETLTSRTPTLTLRSAKGTFENAQVSYEFQITTTTGETVYSRTASGGAADGTSTIAHNVDTPLPPKGQFRWRARAVIGTDVGPWTDSATTGSANFLTNTLSPSSSNAEFRDFFFNLTVQKNLPFPTQDAFRAMEPDLVALDIIIAKDSSGFIRGRIYLPTGGADKYARSVDVITGFGPGNQWVWNERGSTKCEGICP